MKINTPVYGPRRLTKHDVMGIRYLTDGDNADTGAGAGTTDPNAGKSAAPAAPSPADVAAAAAAKGAAVDPDAEKMYPRSYVLGVREEAKNYRTELQSIKQANEALLNENGATKAELAEVRLGSAVVLHAPGAEGNAELLLDSAKFRTSMKDIDVKDKAAVTDAIKKFVLENPAYGTGPVIPGSSGGQRAPGGQQPTAKPKSLGSAVSAAYAN